MSDDHIEVNSSEENPYGYIPTRYICILYLVLFGFSAVAHLKQSIYFRIWWLLPTACLCGVLEVAAWSARLSSSFHPFSRGPYEIQITATIIAPTLLAAANFIILRHIILLLGPTYSRLSLKWYSVIFGALHLISLVLQAVGGGMISVANSDYEDADDAKDAHDRGGLIMLSGIIVQMVTLIIFVAYALEFFIRYLKNKPLKQVTLEGSTADVRGFMSQRAQILCIALAFSTIFLLIRAVYRTIELADGWEGTIMRTEIWFNIFDAAMIVVAMFTLNAAHPGLMLTSSEIKRKGNYSVNMYSMQRSISH